MTLSEFNGSVVPVVLKIWFGKAFADYWNDENQQITFRSFARYPVSEVLEAFREHRFQYPDATKPVWKEITAAMRAAHPDESQSPSRGIEFPSGPMLDKWSADKSDGDLTHLWFIVNERYRKAINNGRKWWEFLESCPLRCDSRVGLCWAAEHGFDLSFGNGTDEWHLILTEIDANERRKAVRQWNFKREPLKPKPLPDKPVEPPKPGDLQNEPLT